MIKLPLAFAFLSFSLATALVVERNSKAKYVQLAGLALVPLLQYPDTTSFNGHWLSLVILKART